MGGDALLLNASEVAGLLGISRSTVWALHWAGRLPAEKEFRELTG